MLTEAALQDKPLCVVGNINRDIKTAPFRSGAHLFQDGESSVASIIETVGGGGANSAFTAAALKARVTFMGKIGNDALGARLERTLIHHGITAKLARDSEHSSGSSIALSFENGHRHFLSCLPANRALAFKDINLNALHGQEHLLRADIWFSESMLFEGNQGLFQVARKMN